MGCKDSLDEEILRDIRNALDMSSSLFPSERQIREYWKDKLDAEREEKEERSYP